MVINLWKLKGRRSRVIGELTSGGKCSGLQEKVVTFRFCLLLQHALKHHHAYQVTLTKVTSGNVDSRVLKLDTNISYFSYKTVAEGGGLLADAFLTIAKHHHLKVAMTRVLFD